MRATNSRGSARVALCAALVAFAGSVGGGELRYAVEYLRVLGGSRDDTATCVVVLPNGAVIVGGDTESPDMSTTPGVLQPKYGGSEPQPGGLMAVESLFMGDCFLFRLSADGATVEAATYFGGRSREQGLSLALDSKGRLVIAGTTGSSNLPVTKGCYGPRFGYSLEWFAGRVSPDLKTLEWCTYVPGKEKADLVAGLVLDGEDNVLLCGSSASPSFPVTASAYQKALRGKSDGVVLKLKADGSEVLFSTFLGGSESDLIEGAALDRSGRIHIGGATESPDFPVTRDALEPKLGGGVDAFYAVLSPDASRLLYATYLGGAKFERTGRPLFAVGDEVLLSGSTCSADFPTTTGAPLKNRVGGFQARLSPDGRRLLLSMLYGQSDNEFFVEDRHMLGHDPRGNLVVVGTTRDPNLPVSRLALQQELKGRGTNNDEDGMLAVLTPDGSKLLYATYLGGSHRERVRGGALGPKGEVYIVGSTQSDDFARVPGGEYRSGKGKDMFILKVRPAD